MAGRGAQEKSIAELKTGFAFDTVPTKVYGANSAWQWLSVLAHNPHRDLQLVRDDSALQVVRHVDLAQAAEDSFIRMREPIQSGRL